MVRLGVAYTKVIGLLGEHLTIEMMIVHKWLSYEKSLSPSDHFLLHENLDQWAVCSDLSQ